MNFDHSFLVNLPVDQAWPLLCDIERISPCVPGAQLHEVAGNEFRGSVKIRLGPITAQYRGGVTLTDVDNVGHRMVIVAKARDVHGQGNASANVIVSLAAEGATTMVALATELQITGKVAQLGRGVMQDVSAKLIQQFADAVEREIQSASSPPTALAPAQEGAAAPAVIAAPYTIALGNTPSPSIRQIDSAPAEAVDLLAISRGAIGRRVALVSVVAAVGAAALYLLL